MIVEKIIHQQLKFVFLISFLSFLVVPCHGADKSGVAPNTISLPSGPGSIEGLGSAFQPMLNTGNSRYTVPISIPSGTAGHSPSLSLQYDSGFGDGPVGIGWSYGPGFITRQIDQGLPLYVDEDNGKDDNYNETVDEFAELDTFLGLDGEELVHVEAGVYRARIESAFIRYRRMGEYWLADLKDGTILEFGSSSNGRITDPSGQKIFTWLLERSTDVNGNVIEFRYTSFPVSDSNKYLKEIRYGPGASPWSAFYFVNFSYEPKPDWRKDYRSTFLVKTAHRLKQIDIGIQGSFPPQCTQGDWNEDSLTDALISRYVLDYTEDSPIVSQLARVTRYGSDGINYLPPISFGYTGSEPDSPLSANQAIINGVNTPHLVMDNELVELVDLNRDGLTDILQTDFTGNSHLAYVNLGTVTDFNGEFTIWSTGQPMGSEDGLALRLHLAEDRVSLADIDGDGIADLVHTTETDDVYYYQNEGKLSWSARKRLSTKDSAPPAPFGSKDVSLGDMDFDKRIDVIRSSDTGYSLWFNREEGEFSRRVTSDGADYFGQVLLFSDSGVELADLNGDRLNDMARITQGHVIYCANRGFGNFAEAVIMPITGVILSDGENGQVSRAKLTDINGDGLADLVVERAAVNELWFWLNLGTDDFSSRFIVTDMPSVTSSSASVRWADLNGNGTTDLVYADSSASERLQVLDIGKLISGPARPNMLARIDNGLGVTTHISYKSSTDFYVSDKRLAEPWETTVPFPVHVVSEVRTTSGLDLDDLPGLDEYHKSYFYRDGFYEDRQKQFRGFAEVRVIEHGDTASPTVKNVHRFFTGGPDGIDNDYDGLIDEVAFGLHREEEALKGLVRSLETRTQDTIFNRMETYWSVKNIDSSLTGEEIRFARKDQVDTLVYEGTSTPETLRTTFTYDNYGNVTTERDYGALSLTGDEVFSFTEYINDTSAWLIGLPRRLYSTDGYETQKAETRLYYDGTDFIGLPLGQATKGKLTRKEGWVEGATYVDLFRSGYDQFGNVTATLDPNGNRINIDYDPTLYQFPVRETIEVGGSSPDLVVEALYNSGLTVLTESTDFNGNKTQYVYDVFGRLTSVVRPGDSAGLPTQEFRYRMVDPAGGLTYNYDGDGTLTPVESSVLASTITTKLREVSGQAGTLDTITYVDGLGRSLAKIEESDTGYVVSDAVRLTARGAVHRSLHPYSALSAEYTPPTLTMPSVETRYDAAGRVVKTINPDQTSLVTEYLPLEKRVFDEKNVRKDLLTDGQDQLITVKEYNDGTTHSTSYNYDTLGNLLQLTDAHNNVKTMVYDGLQRRTSMDDPDKGHMAYVYDAASNLISTTDNKGQTILYDFDGAGRILSEDFLDGANITPDVTYHYDILSPVYPAATNINGALSWIDDLSGSRYFSYDERGNVSWTVGHVNGLSGDYQSENEFDSLGRLTALTYPDGERISYHYNNRGQLETVPGFVDSITYTPSGQREAITYANGVVTEYGYDNRLRLGNLSTISLHQSPDFIQQLSYGFDMASNITAITDHINLALKVPGNGSQSFVYDELYRLTHAQGPGYGSIDFNYDAIGNMIAKQSPNAPSPEHINDPLINLGAMSYGGTSGTSNRGARIPGYEPGPHAITATASGLAYDYDDNGNMTSHAYGDVYEWDFKDRLIRSVSNGVESTYIYGHAGQRVIKQVDDGNTVRRTFYIEDHFEIRDGLPVKFVFDDSRRVARIDGGQQFHLQSGWNFIFLKVEPDNSAIAEVLSSISGSYTEVWEYETATGQYRGYVPVEGLSDLTELHGLQSYIIKMTEPAHLIVMGPQATGSVDLSTGWNLVGTPTQTTQSPPEAYTPLAGAYDTVWGYENEINTWQSYLTDRQSFLNNLETVNPDSAYWLKIGIPTQLQFPDQPLRIYFYHTDHLGSSSLVTDGKGLEVESTKFYPFGRPRYEVKKGFTSSYKYTGKELDQDTGLMYFEARYYDPIIGRFIGVDPLYVEFGNIINKETTGSMKTPVLYNLYVYTKNNPLNIIDPTGLVPEDFEYSSNEMQDPAKRELYINSATKELSPKEFVQWGMINRLTPDEISRQGKEQAKLYKQGKNFYRHNPGASKIDWNWKDYRLLTAEDQGKWLDYFENKYQKVPVMGSDGRIVTRERHIAKEAWKHYGLATTAIKGGTVSQFTLVNTGNVHAGVLVANLTSFVGGHLGAKNTQYSKHSVIFDKHNVKAIINPKNITADGPGRF